MKVVELLSIGGEMLKLMSANDVLRDDYRFVKMYDEFTNMRRLGVKYREAVRMLSEDYGISRSTVERAVSRLGKDIGDVVKRPRAVRSRTKR